MEYTSKHIVINGSKVCNECNRSLSVELFPINKATKAGYDYKCKECRSKKYIYQQGSHFKNTYGITLDQYYEMLESQNGVCAICSHSPTNDKRGWLFVDHCHSTGAVRGLLCKNCNSMLGHARDETEILSSAIGYLNAHLA